ncbi:HET-domain-containing protein [Plenodomus tracheiphilus IPT5]|uniref:HET-domain-containing protein n=1 Tax=Plenodomus tracheiphilus IPT5 TaxID=1408161 RepID=A0A6A7AYM3_9PLEO|nr:HET-domain-containing protein [Plenodomus tracheiphilus IPT5]
MRLLHIQDDAELHLVERTGNDIPPYAILSHTWGKDEDEVTFGDLKAGTGTSKAGYRKLEFCRHQAKTDGLNFVWVDTCCIDKSSSAELTEAINSMFRWYQNAARCYVYLSDVSIPASAQPNIYPQSTWFSSFRHSRWFTRGWTLQELLGTGIVDFFSAEGAKLGDKACFKQELNEITGIPVDVLEGRELSHFSIQERLSWAEGRETKREEDAAYSLLGIFDIYMPLIYGEGRTRAFRRLLKEINELLQDQVSSAATNQAPEESLELPAFHPPEEVHLDRSKTIHDPIAALPMWPGNFVRTKFSKAYCDQRDLFSTAAYHGRWEEVFRLCDVAQDEYGENWANVIRLRSPHQADELSFWTPLHQAAYLRAPINVIKMLISKGALRTIRTQNWSEGKHPHRDLTAAEMAQSKRHHHVADILAPVIYHTIPHRTLARLQALFHEMIRADWEHVDDVILPDLVALTELRVPEMWFPLGVQQAVHQVVGYRYRIEERELVVTKLGIEQQSPSVYRVR